ncbi:N7-demethylase (plasmid) [Paraburkholderia caffeinilytica]|uniref:(2Fe-2S)-binding protein n=3 Tax=Paraburkholderia TaxID=1822464 RepID=A0A290LKZ6_9BURK|nr:MULTISPECIES: aromatic ring-hydroxylating dioxygenase subunit alpha [Paraburkholderia]ATC20477.1 methylxanthine N7-demethylase [Paraburkholderia caffeinilytica]AXL53962.1 N7-demethylase [Paraburkholderia caffeinilytica]CAB3781986.1 putative methylxanthine N7-demethylase NdmC [Paraburkholderia caffeinitolerans]CAB3802560.1 putative methylxanthine N7-demethylase NdmC [Paraburkholderia caffeinilytica]GGC64926.1 (2Fe-2S)-binding protein [Paraburkholderia caffeinilytica]
MNFDEQLFDDWHPVAASEDILPDRRFHTRLLGRVVSYSRKGSEVTAQWDDDGTERKMSAIEQYGALWLSFSSNPRSLFKVPEFSEPDRRIVSAGSTRVHTSGLRAVENFLDMAHFPFVHTDILGAEPHTDVAPYTVKYDEQVDEIIATECKFPQPRGSATATDALDMDYIYRVTRPYIAILYKTCPPDPSRWDVLCLFVQPVDEEWCIAHTLMCYVDDVNSDEQLRHFQQTIFGQDLMILVNQVPRRLPLTAKTENPVRADVLATAYRKWMRDGGLTYGAICD